MMSLKAVMKLGWSGAIGEEYAAQEETFLVAQDEEDRGIFCH